MARSLPCEPAERLTVPGRVRRDRCRRLRPRETFDGGVAAGRDELTAREEHDHGALLGSVVRDAGDEMGGERVATHPVPAGVGDRAVSKNSSPGETPLGGLSTCPPPVGWAMKLSVRVVPACWPLSAWATAIAPAGTSATAVASSERRCGIWTSWFGYRRSSAEENLCRELIGVVGRQTEANRPCGRSCRGDHSAARPTGFVLTDDADRRRSVRGYGLWVLIRLQAWKLVDRQLARSRTPSSFTDPIQRPVTREGRAGAMPKPVCIDQTSIRSAAGIDATRLPAGRRRTPGAVHRRSNPLQPAAL